MDEQTHTTLGREILTAVRNELYLSLRFLDAALSGLRYELNPLTATTATDGETLYFQPHYLFRSYDENPVLVNRACLHSLLHCLFSHLYIEAKPDRSLWDLCCDLCVESILDSLDVPCLRRIPSDLRERTYQYIQTQGISLYTPGNLYRLLENNVFYRQNMPLLEQDFCIDSHHLWPHRKDRDTPEPRRKETNYEKWQELGDRTRTNMETFERRAGTKAGSLREMLRSSYGDPLRYDRFLRRFAVWHESLHMNEEEFDTAYYTLGMQLYHNIPLIEPLEYREEKRIRDLVIAVDTSGSVHGTPIRRFLAETLAILQNTHRFFSDRRIHLLQFDTVIQEDLLITSWKELASLADSFVVKGFGGTDYRCVFDYIAKEQDTGRYSTLQGLMILTDGFGTYPAVPPPYPTAFLLADFLAGDTARTGDLTGPVPNWAIRLRIGQDQKELS